MSSTIQQSSVSSTITPQNSNSVDINMDNMNQKLARAASRRIFSLFHARTSSSGSSGGVSSSSAEASSVAPSTADTGAARGGKEKDYSNKNRPKELKRLAKTMEMEVPRLKTLLKNQVPNIHHVEEKRYFEWLLDVDKSGSGNANGSAVAKSAFNGGESNDKKIKRERSNSSLAAKGNVQTSEKRKKKGQQGNDTVDRGSHETMMDEKKEDIEYNNEEEEGANTIHDTSLLSTTKFQSITNLHPSTKRAISSVLKLEYMTEIQSKTWEATSTTGVDVLGRARVRCVLVELSVYYCYFFYFFSPHT